MAMAAKDSDRYSPKEAAERLVAALRGFKDHWPQANGGYSEETGGEEGQGEEEAPQVSHSALVASRKDQTLARSPVFDESFFWLWLFGAPAQEAPSDSAEIRFS